MNIAVIIQDLRMRGGAERRTSQLIRELIAAGHEVHLYANRCDPQAAEGVVFHHVPMLNVPRPLKPLSFAWFCSQVIPRGKHDLVHTQARIFRYDTVTLGVGCHRAFLEAIGVAPLRSRDKWFHRAVMHIERKMLAPGSYRRIITNSRKVRDEIGRYYAVPESDVTVIHNGVDHDAFSPGVRDRLRPGARAELGLRRDEVAVVLVGTGFEHKGVRDLIRAIGIFAKGKRPLTMRAFIVGAGKTEPYERIMADLGVSDLIVWAGKSSDVRTYYAAADIYVLPTLYDAFSNSTMEALACGLPVITTRTNGVSEILTEGESAFIVEPRDPESLADRLGLLIEAPALRERMGSAAQKAAEPYTWQRTAEETIRVYEEILGIGGI